MKISFVKALGAGKEKPIIIPNNGIETPMLYLPM
jgi:hypothetical protein